MSEIADEKKQKRIEFYECAEKAKKIIKYGDKIGCTRCPGTKRVFTFSQWDGPWMVSKTGIDEYSPRNIYSINGKPINIKELPK